MEHEFWAGRCRPLAATPCSPLGAGSLRNQDNCMYKKTETTPTAALSNGVEITPVATLKDDHGGVAHIWVDDHCYVLGLEREHQETSDSPVKTVVKLTNHIFHEALEVLKALPDLAAA